MRNDGDEERLRKLIDGEIGGEREEQRERAKRMGMAFADLHRIQIDPEARDSITTELARELRALPVKRDGRTLWVAFAEPNSSSENQIAYATGMRVVPVLCLRDALDDALARL